MDAAARPAVDFIMECLSAMESAAFGSFPNQVNAFVPPDLSNEMPRLLVIRKKLHGLAMRTFSAENAVLGLRDGGSHEQTTTSINPVTLEGHIFALEANVKHLLALQTDQKSSSVAQPDPLRSVDIDAKLGTILNAVVDQSVDLSASSGQTGDILRQLKVVQDDTKDILDGIRKFHQSPVGQAADTFRNEPRQSTKCICNGNMDLERNLAALKTEVGEMTSLLLDVAKGAAPTIPKPHSDDIPEVSSFKMAITALLDSVQSSSTQKDHGQDAPPDQPVPGRLNQKAKKQIAIINAKLDLMCSGVLPPPFESSSIGNIGVVTIQKRVNRLISIINSVHELATKSEGPRGGLASDNVLDDVSGVPLHGVWAALVACKPPCTSLLAMDGYLDNLVAGNFDDFPESEPVNVTVLRGKLKSFRDDYMHFTEEVVGGNLRATMVTPSENDNAWTDMRNASATMHQKVIQDLTIISDLINMANRGVVAANTLQDLKDGPVGIISKLAARTERLFSSIQEHHQDIEQLAMSTMTPECKISLFPTRPYGGIWKASRKAFNEILFNIAGV